ncbi:putative AbiEii toxin of type IV toxin-antitoxin system [Pseudonocardia sediminis]|uniref:Putative AbiEii toxin of type IV toxin-antitoxin system n=1 Tax=Pseudonocardia sediminis TaxID=1397368 RepID=A0A4Q7V638_PSEST|nr:ATP-binding protein [Pseudonocardia sediminis]RZT89061.1 putative AbiEii toxin of type IV toxin-antitoxin system [Pseudonocardia sediminis]
MLPRLKSVSLQNGQRVDPSDGVTVIVGPNNAGKTRLLRETFERLNQPNIGPNQHLVVGEVELEWPGSLQEFIGWIDRVYGWRPPGQYPDGTHGERTFQAASGVTLESQVHALWGTQTHIHPLGGMYALQLDAQSRLNASLDSPAFNPRTQTPTAPAQHLWNSRELEAEVSALMDRAFGESLTVDRYAGNEIHLLVGRPSSVESGPPPSKIYLDELQALRRLNEQGDGMRAFMGMLLTIRTSEYKVILIDEPEAFLHPPQARLLGRILSEQHGRGTQVIVATHSENIVQGITGGAPKAGFDPTIVRISRQGGPSHASQIPIEKVQQLYHDPLLRHSSVLDGLFYQGVAVCEGDSDCAYYNAVLTHLTGSDQLQVRDVHFMHCGGKDRVWKAIDALRAARVPCVAVLDFDALRSDAVLSSLMSTQGGNLEEIRSDLNTMRNAIISKTRPASRIAAKAEIDQVFTRSGSQGNISNNDRELISNALSGSDGWAEAKNNGRRILAGDALNAFDRVNSWLRRHGVFVVADGELESFNREVPAGNKAKWLATVLEGRLYEGANKAHSFVKEMCKALSDQKLP